VKESAQSEINKGGYWKYSPDLTTKCTWDEDINVNEFLIEDFEYLLNYEKKLQTELL